MSNQQVVVRWLGIVDYQETLSQMIRFTAERKPNTPDEFWILQHTPVYTQGYSCNLLPQQATEIPVVATDRGGQITYHGPGQLIIYLLLDVKRRKHGIRQLVRCIESAIVDVLQAYGVYGETKLDAPGVYVASKKIASLGLRVSRGYSYHGISINVDMDHTPFEFIDVCGIQGLEVTTLRKLGVDADINDVAEQCLIQLNAQLQ